MWANTFLKLIRRMKKEKNACNHNNMNNIYHYFDYGDDDGDNDVCVLKKEDGMTQFFYKEEITSFIGSKSFSSNSLNSSIK